MKWLVLVFIKGPSIVDVDIGDELGNWIFNCWQITDATTACVVDNYKISESEQNQNMFIVDLYIVRRAILWKIVR